MIFQAEFKNPKKDVPETNSLTVDVYFTVKDILYKGYYHINKCYYADERNNRNIFASANGTYDPGFGHGDGKNDVCTGWCYVDELIHIK